MKLAAIDIGSNAIKLLLCQAEADGTEIHCKKDAFLRVPIRLGDDVFRTQRLSDDKIEGLIEALTAFKHLIQAYHPVGYSAYATAAMREAANAPEILAQTKERTQIDIEIIDGRREAEILYSNGYAEKVSRRQNCLLIDVGGGSTELTIISKSKFVNSKSFDIGTVRMITGTDDKTEWRDMQRWVKAQAQEYGPLLGIGTGGSINKIVKVSRTKPGKPLSFRTLRKTCEFLIEHSLEEKIQVLKLIPNRADVIEPAGKIFLLLMDWAAIKKLYVPQLGLADGMIRLLYERHRKAAHQS